MKIGNKTVVGLTDSPDRSMREHILETNAWIVSAALAESGAPLVLLDGCLTLVTAGQRVLVNLPVLQQIIDKHFSTAAVVNHGTIEKPHWVLEAQPVVMRYLEDYGGFWLAKRDAKAGCAFMCHRLD
jgi:hypothetical protein